MHAVGEPTEPVGPFSRVLGLVTKERDAVRVIVIYAVAVGMTSLAAPLGVQALVNSIAFSGLRQPLFVLSLLVFFALLVGAILQGLQWAVAERIQARIFARSALQLSRVLPRSKMAGKAVPPEFVNRFFDVVTIQKGAAMLLTDGVYAALSALVGFVLLAFYHPYLFAYGATLFVLASLIVVSLLRAGEKTSKAESVQKYAVVAWFEEVARHKETFRGRDAEAFAEARGRELVTEYVRRRERHFRIVHRQGILFFLLGAGAVSALLGVGGLLVLEGQISLGQLIAAELVIGNVTGAFAKLGKYLESYYDLFAAADKLGHLLQLEEEKSGKALPTNGADGPLVNLSNVTVKSHDGREILRRVHFSLRPGERVCVLGANGAGKTTLVDVLWGLLDASSGSVEVLGHPLRSLNVAALREQIALVRGSDLFDGTLHENVCLGRDISREAVRAALESVDAWREVTSLPLGLDTPAKEASLSPGCVRRVLLARAMVGNPKVLLIDGVLDGIDALSREALTRGILGPSSPWAVVCTTHDRVVTELFDRTYEMADGILDRPKGPGGGPSKKGDASVYGS